MTTRVLIINQDTDLDACVAMADGADRLVFVTSHQLFDEERRALVEKMSAPIEVLSLADLLDDELLARFDARATKMLRPDELSPVQRLQFNAQHMSVSAEFKNAAVFHALSERFEGAEFAFTPGLGISGAVWQRYGSKPLATRQAVAAGETASTETPFLSVVQCGEARYVFVTSIKRLKLRSDATVTRVPLAGGLQGLLTQPDPDQALRHLLATMDQDADGFTLATTIHGYVPQLLAFGRPLHVLVDGYHPPNYPRSYIDSYDPRVVFECREPISRRWFIHHGRACTASSPILEPARMNGPRARWGNRRPVAMVALNHAGDWSALIHRSDTDRLVMAAAKLASAFPELDVVLRPHPTMAHPAHEGSGSRERIEAYCRDAGLSNLMVSQLSLDEDFERSDIVLSEYSQVLIDAIAMGRLGMVVNLTGRRSFMEAYEQLGLLVASDEETMTTNMNTLLNDTESALATQGSVVARFNALAAATEAGCAACGGHEIKWQGSAASNDNHQSLRCETCGHETVIGVNEMNHSSKGNESDAGPTASLLARLRSATTPAPTSVPEAPRPPAPKPVAAAQAVAELTPSAKAPVAASSGYTVVAPATGDAQAWHQQSVAEAQERAFRPLLDQMKAGQVREDFRSVADAIEATGLEAPTVLEVGCGSGYYHEVLGHLLGSKVKHVGVDYSEAMIALAKSRYPQGQFHVGDATRLPFADRSYDIVMDGVALMHIQDYERAIQEARRVARHFVIFNTAVLLASRSTTRLNKRAYGQETSEFILNEGELRMLLAKYGMYVAASFESIPYDLHDTLGEHTYTKTIVCGLIGEAHDAGSVLVNLGCGSHFHPIWMNIDIASPHPAVHEHNLMAGVPLPDESCDAVYHSHVLEHMPKHQAEPFIAECFRVLKPGGVIRIAIPDLEQICRHYLSNLDSAVEGDQEAAHRYDWMMMELIDQMTRNESGGEMGRYWRQNPMPAEDFVIERVGQEVKGYLAQVRAQGGGQPPRRQWSAAEIGTFRQSGEIHQWMYDRFSLKRLLTKAGFVGARVCQANESRIHRFGDYQLDTDDSGQTRKPDSLFMEAVRV